MTTRARSTKWWLESLGFLAICGAFILWQGKSWLDLTEVKAIAVMAVGEFIRSRLKDEE